jgi:hypothetical protein
MRSPRRLTALAFAFSLIATTGLQTGCGGPEEETDDIVDLGMLSGKADDPLRDVTLTVAGGVTKWYRIRTVGFVATLEQSGTVPVQLSAKHGDVDILGEPATAPTVVASGETAPQTWTLRVKNLGSTKLDGRLVVRALTDPPPPSGGTEIGIISDIDDTVMPPLKRGMQPPAYPGVGALYTALELLDGGQLGDLFYVTARTPERVVGMDEWMTSQGLPVGAIETGISGQPWIARPEKIADIVRIFDSRPEQKFVLFGDTKAADPEVYRDITKRYPDRVLAVFIHNVKASPPERTEGMFLIDHYAQAAAILYSLKIFDERTARDVIDVAVKSGLALTANDVDDLIASIQPR